jgi:hypothetical protein
MATTTNALIPTPVPIPTLANDPICRREILPESSNLPKIPRLQVFSADPDFVKNFTSCDNVTV